MYTYYLLTFIALTSASLNAMIRGTLPKKQYNTIYVELMSDERATYDNLNCESPELGTKSLESLRDWLRKLAERLGLVRPQDPAQSTYYSGRQDSAYCPACDISYNAGCSLEGCATNDNGTCGSSCLCSPCTCSPCECSTNQLNVEGVSLEQQSFTIPLPEHNQQLIIRTNWPYLLVYTLIQSEWGSWLYSDTIRVYNMMTEEYTELSAAGLYQFFDQLPFPPTY